MTKMALVATVMMPFALLAIDAGEKIMSMTPEQRAERKEFARLRKLKRTGGQIEKPGSQKGYMIVLDAQKAAASTNILNLTQTMSKFTKIEIKYERADPAAVAGGDWNAIMKQKGALAIIAVVYDDKTPSVLVAPYDQWAVVNVKKVEAGLNDAGKARFLDSRAAKLVAKAMAMLAGSCSQFPHSPASALTLDEIDSSGEMLPVDQIEHVTKFMLKLGATRKIVTTYRIACQDGWAPAPTNDFQKAIWNEVHEIPSKPIKIEKK